MKRFSTFEGVFTPCLLSILGVVMYLRLGWVVGRAGIGMAVIIIVFANFITLATALSMSSIVTNIRIGAGGAYSIIAKSLGIEAGGAIGIPLYLAQAVSVAFYITGFTECWISIFPLHNGYCVSLTAWFVLLVVSYASARLAFRLQYGIMAVVALSLVSVFLGNGQESGMAAGSSQVIPGYWHELSFKDFWKVFAIFFPAVTGILAGAVMSGELKDPKSSIPKGTLSAMAVSFCIYIGLAVWLSRHAASEELIQNTSILIQLSRWKWLVVAGIMGATLSSAISMFVGSPRTLMALGKHSIIPFSSSFVRINKRGEPTAAILFTALLVLVTLLYGTLDSVANLLTMFFLITYGMINLSVFIEQTMGIASFRPAFRISRFIPFFGGLSCIGIMFLINMKLSLIVFIVMIAIYIVLLRREVKIHSPDVRSGLLIFVAEQLTKAAACLPYHPKIWKPNLLIPVEDTAYLSRVIPFIKAVVCPTGRVLFFKVTRSHQAKEEAKNELLSVVAPLKEEKLFVEVSVAQSPDCFAGSMTVMQTVKDKFFPPNTLFYILQDGRQREEDVINMIKGAEQEGLGVIILKMSSKTGFSREKAVNVWIRRKSPNLDLSILIALQLRQNWDGHVRLIQAVGQEEGVTEAQGYLDKLRKLLRLPSDAQVTVLVGDFENVLTEAPPADINIFGMPEEPDLMLVRKTFDAVKTSVLFLRDSKHESAVA